MNRSLADMQSALALAIAMRDRDMAQDIREEIQDYKDRQKDKAA